MRGVKLLPFFLGLVSIHITLFLVLLDTFFNKSAQRMRLNTFPLFLTGRFLYRVHIKVRQGHHIITYWFVVYNFETLK